MSFRILIPFSIFVVLVLAAPSEREKRCACTTVIKDGAISRGVNNKDGTELLRVDKTYGKQVTCEEALSSCERECCQSVGDPCDEKQTNNINVNFGRRICNAWTVRADIKKEKGEQISMDVSVHGCEGAKKEIEFGQICCHECHGPASEQSNRGIYYLFHDCSSTDDALTAYDCPEGHHPDRSTS